MIDIILIGWLVVGFISGLYILIHGYCFHKMKFILSDTTFLLFAAIGGVFTLYYLIVNLRSFLDARNKAKK